MRSLVPIPLMFLTAVLPGCAENHFLPGAVPTTSYVETDDGHPFVMTKLIGGPSEVGRESCGGR